MWKVWIKTGKVRFKIALGLTRKKKVLLTPCNHRMSSKFCPKEKKKEWNKGWHFIFLKKNIKRKIILDIWILNIAYFIIILFKPMLGSFLDCKCFDTLSTRFLRFEFADHSNGLTLLCSSCFWKTRSISICFITRIIVRIFQYNIWLLEPLEVYKHLKPLIIWSCWSKGQTFLK